MPLSLKEDTNHSRAVPSNDGTEEEAAPWNDEPQLSPSKTKSSKRRSSAQQNDPLLMPPEDPQETNNDESPKGRSSKKRFLIPALVGGGIVLLLVILLPIVLTRNKNDKNDNNDEPEPAVPTKPVSPAPLTPNEVLGVQLPQYTLAALESDDAKSSPQAQALDWMQIDPKLDTYSEEQRLQRFALATLYYALNGQDWNTTATLRSSTETRDDGSTVTVSTTTTSTEAWLSYDKPECEWMTSTKTVTRIADYGDDDAITVIKEGTADADAAVAAVDDGGDGRRRLRFTEMKSLCGSKSGTGSPMQARAYNRNMNMNMNGGMNNRRRRRNMKMNMNGHNWNGGRNGHRDYYYYDHDNDYDSYYYRYSGSKGRGGSKGRFGRSGMSGMSSKGGYYYDDDDYYYYYRRRDLAEDLANEDDPWEPVKYLHLPDNNVFGSLPPELALLTAVESIDFSANGLSGTLPTEIFATMKRLTSLTLQDNFLSGALPSHIGLWSNNMHNHKDNGLLTPAETDAAAATRGMTLNFGRNYFNETVPSVLAQLTTLSKLILANNNFTGPMIPSSFVALTNLHTLNLGANRLTGPILTKPLEAMTQLQELYLHINQLTGTIPEQLGLLTTLRILELDNNAFDGTLPNSLRLLQELDRLLLYNNALEGPIPTHFGTMTALKILGLTNNDLASTIPSELGLMSSLEHLWLYQNQLMGFIPTELGNLGRLQILAVHDNPLIGLVPEPLCDLDYITFDCAEDLQRRLLCGCNCTCMGENGELVEEETPPTQPPAEIGAAGGGADEADRTPMPTGYRFPEDEKNETTAASTEGGTPPP